MTSKRTKQIRTVYWILNSTSILLTVGPLIIYIAYGMAVSEPQRKVVLSMTAVCAIILGVINVLMKKHLRSVIWILLLGVSFALENITTLVIIMAVCTVIDEFAITPVLATKRAQLITNKEIDRRGSE